MNWLALFHEFFIPFIGGIALTLGKAIADEKAISFKDSNDIALDLVMVGVGALGALYIKAGAVESTIDAGIGDVFLAAILLYLRFRKKHREAQVGLPGEIGQLILGVAAVVWTIKAF
jgi:hypothetical protein